MPASSPASAHHVDEDLEAILARVTGSRHQRRHAGYVAVRDRVVAQRCAVDVGEWSQDLRGAGPLNGHQRYGQRPILDRAVEYCCSFSQRVPNTSDVRGIGNHHVPLVGKPIDDQVVHDPAVGEADHRVMGPPDCKPAGIRDEGVC
jgi:hypothetical protein